MEINLNYNPNPDYPLVISKPSIKSKNFYIYEQYEVDPITPTKFKTIEIARAWADKYFHDFNVIIDNKCCAGL